MPTVLTVRAQAGETVEIQWRLDDGGSYVTRHTVPPRATREAVIGAISASLEADVPVGALCAVLEADGTLCREPAVLRCRFIGGVDAYVCQSHASALKPLVPDTIGFKVKPAGERFAE